MTLDDRIEDFLTGRLGDAAQERARADAAEADLAFLRELYVDRDHDLKHEHQRAETAEADLLAVRETLAGVIDERDDARNEAAECREERADYGDMMTSKLATAEAESERLSRENIGHRVTMLQLRADVESARAEIERLRALWQRAIDADILDDAHELGNAIADASALLNYPPPGEDD